ncbi:MAG: methyltransferase domain-containing protein [Acidimicrobiales bacterium]
MSTSMVDTFGGGSMPEAYRLHLEPAIFRPWAERLIDLVGVEEGAEVLDVASGTGAVARTAARRAGRQGRVVASDSSAEMLSQVLIGRRPDDAPIQTLQCPATSLDLADASLDAVFCQQGFPFIEDRLGAAIQMRRVLRPGGVAGVAVWLSGVRLDPFETYAEVLAQEDIDPPFPAAYDMAHFTMSEDEIAEILTRAGFDNVEARVNELEVSFASGEAAAKALWGTPYSKALGVLGSARQEGVLAKVAESLAPQGGPPSWTMTAVLGRGRA